MLSSPACWAAYGELLAVQYSTPERMPFHQVVVDAYAVQHPGDGDPRAVQSVAIHLMTLHLFLDRGVDPVHGTRLHRQMLTRPHFHRLGPPDFRGRLTHLVVPRTGAVDAARDAAYEWARDVWDAWSAHHATVQQWVSECGLGGESRGRSRRQDRSQESG